MAYESMALSGSGGGYQPPNRQNSPLPFSYQLGRRIPDAFRQAFSLPARAGAYAVENTGRILNNMDPAVMAHNLFSPGRRVAEGLASSIGRSISSMGQSRDLMGIANNFRDSMRSAAGKPKQGVGTQQNEAEGGSPFLQRTLSSMLNATGVPGLATGLMNEYGDDATSLFNQARDFVGNLPQPREVDPISPTAVDPPVAQQSAPRMRNRFGPPGPTGTDFGQGVMRNMALGHLNQFMQAPQNLVNQLNSSFDRSANRNLILNNQRLQQRRLDRELSLRDKELNLRDKHNQRLTDAILEVLGGGAGGGAGGAGPIPPGAIESANAALRQVKPNMGSPYLSQLMQGNIRMRAPDIERTLTPANRSLGLAMDQNRTANLQSLLGFMR